jgi:hypothetical protein
VCFLIQTATTTVELELDWINQRII